jgi:hypothetical protein
MVPPFTTAIRFAPSRAPRACPTTRSHVMRGRSSANSSPGGYRPREHVQHALVRRSRQLGEGRRAAHHRVELLRVHHGPSRDMATTCCASTSSGFTQVVASPPPGPPPFAPSSAAQASRSPRYLGKNHAARHGAHLVPGAPDALQPRGHRGRCLDLHHQVHRAHVDAQLQRRRGHDARAASPRFEPLLDLLARLLGDASRGARARPPRPPAR